MPCEQTFKKSKPLYFDRGECDSRIGSVNSQRGAYFQTSQNTVAVGLNPALDLSIATTSKGRGFSLVELLVVVALIAILAYLAVPALSSIASARGTVDSAYKIAEAIEFARSEAVARRTFVWLGLQDSTNSGNRNLNLGGVFSKDGTTNTSSANLQPLFRPMFMERVGLVESADTGANSARYSGASVLATNQSGVAFYNGSQTFNGKTITFTPTGEAMLTGLPTSSTVFEGKILIGLRLFRGTAEASNNDVAVVVDGASGIPAIYQK